MAYIASTGMAGVRVKRDALLAKTDHLALPDSPLSEGMRIAFAEYRQALRDVTKQELPIQWPEYPTKPAPVPEPVEVSLPEPAITYSARIEEYRQEGETDFAMKRRLLKEMDEKLNLISKGGASIKVQAEYERLHEILYQLKDV